MQPSFHSPVASRTSASRQQPSISGGLRKNSLPELNELRLSPQAKSVRHRLQHILSNNRSTRGHKGTRANASNSTIWVGDTATTRPRTVSFEDSVRHSNQSIRADVNDFIAWVQTDWQAQRDQRIPEVSRRSRKRSLAKRPMTVAQEDGHTTDQVALAIKAFETWMTNDWPGLRFLKGETSTESMSTVCATYSRKIRDDLINGFRRDLRKEMLYHAMRKRDSDLLEEFTLPEFSEEAMTELSAVLTSEEREILLEPPSTRHQVLLLSRWFDLTLQQIEDSDLNVHANMSVEKRQLSTAADDVVDKDDPDRDIHPDEAAAKRLWRSSKMVAAGVCYNGLIEHVKEHDKSLGGLMHRVWLEILRAVHTQMTSAEARCQRAEKLALNMDRELQASKKAKQGWGMMRKAQRGLSTMRSLNARMLSKKQSAQEERIKMVEGLTNEERMEVVRKSLTDVERRNIALEFLKNDPTIMADAGRSLKEAVGRQIVGQMKTVAYDLFQENPQDFVDGATRLTKRKVLQQLIEEDPRRALAKNMNKIGNGDPEEIAKILEFGIHGCTEAPLEWREAVSGIVLQRLAKRDGMAVVPENGSTGVSTSTREKDFADLLDVLVDASANEAKEVFSDKVEKVAQSLGHQGIDVLLSAEVTRNFIAHERRNSAGELQDKWWKANTHASNGSLKNQATRKAPDIFRTTQTTASDFKFASDVDSSEPNDLATGSGDGQLRVLASMVKTAPHSTQSCVARDDAGSDDGEKDESLVEQELRRRNKAQKNRKFVKPVSSDDPVGMSVMLWRQNGKRRPKKTKLVTLKTLLATIAELIQAKAGSLRLDEHGQVIHTPFPEFIRDWYLIKYGKNDKAHQLTLRRMEQLTSSVEYHYDTNPRVRSFAQACGINSCCKSGICGCTVPELDISRDQEEDPKQKKKKRKSIRFEPKYCDALVNGILRGFNLPVGQGPEAYQDLAKLLTTDGKGPGPMVFQSRLTNYAADFIPGFRTDEGMVAQTRELFSKTAGHHKDGAGKEVIDIDAGLEILLNLNVSETKRLHVIEMKEAVLTIERLIIRRNAHRQARFLSENIRLVLERESLANLYKAHDIGNDGCQSITEFYKMMSAIDPLLPKKEQTHIYFEEMAFLRHEEERLSAPEITEDEGSYEATEHDELASDISDDEETNDAVDHDQSGGVVISGEQFIRMVWRLGYVLNKSTGRWHKPAKQ